MKDKAEKKTFGRQLKEFAAMLVMDGSAKIEIAL